MAVTFEIGSDFGAAAVRLSPTGQIEFDDERIFEVALTPAPPYITSITDLEGTPRAGGLVETDDQGQIVRSLVTVDELDDVPAEIWLHAHGAAAGLEWSRYRLGRAGSGGGGTPGGPSGSVTVHNDVGWSWSGTDMTSGKAAPPKRLREDITITRLSARTFGGVPTGPTVLQWRYRDRATGVEADAGPAVTVATGATYAESAALAAVISPADLWPVLVTAPPAGAAGGSATTIVATTPTTSAAATSSTYTLAMPAGGADGDLVVAMISDQAQHPSMPAAWTQRANVATVPTGTASIHSQSTVYTAPWSAGLDMTLTLDPYTPSGGSTTSTSPLVATVCILRNADTDDPIGDVTTIGPDNASGGATLPTTLATPALPITVASDLSFVVGSWRAPGTISGQGIACSGSPTELVEQVTTRSGITNVGHGIYSLGAQVVGTPIASKTLTVSGGTGTAGASMSAVVFTIKRKPGTAAPTMIHGWLDYDVTRDVE